MSKIVRGRLSFDDQFTQVPNAWLRDDRLSYKARGLLAYLMSHREGWSVSVDTLAKASKDGRDSVRTGLKELEALGYLLRDRERDASGKLGDPIYVLQEPMTENPSLDNPSAENPTVGKPADLRTTSLSEEQGEELLPLPGLEDVSRETQQSIQDSTFEHWWEIWPKKVAKQDARKVWPKAVKAAGSLERIMHATSRLRYQVDQKLVAVQYLPNPDRWLRGERWTDNEVPTQQAQQQQSRPSEAVRDKTYHRQENLAAQLTQAERDELTDMAVREGRFVTNADVQRYIESKGK